MNLRHPNIEIPQDNPFLNCKLERKKYAEVLKEVVSSSNGFVLAINNEWGTGKTTFIKMWRQLLINENFRTIYFNAWENDFETTPLPAILAELKTLLTHKNKKSFNSLLDKGATIAQNVIPSVAKGLAKNYLGIDVSEGVENATKAATEILKDEISKYTARQNGMLDFRKKLEYFVSKDENNKPLVFIVDELDRCRPSYSVEFLEHIKHFFSVKGIVFVLAIDKKQLCSSINGAYGSDAFDSTDYLSRFIDVEYSLPAPSASNYCSYLFGHYGFGEFFNSSNRLKYRELQNEANAFVLFSATLFDSANLTLRQQEKIYAHARISIRSFKENSYAFPAAFVLLIYLNKFKRELYLKIRNQRLSIQEFVNEIELILKPLFTQEMINFVLQTDALLMFLYGNYYKDSDRSVKLLRRNTDSSKVSLSVTSVLDDSLEYRVLSSHIEAFGTTNFSGIRIDYLLNKIDLFENLI